MSKELPFFKFTSNEWLTGDINFEDYEIQGLFIAVCATYWSKDCSITLPKLKQRLSNAKDEQWQCLIDGGYIKVTKDNVSIAFLDEQIQELSEQRNKRVEAGRKGGQASVKQRLSNAKPKVKHKDIDKDIEVDKEKEELITVFDIFWKSYDYNVGLRQVQDEWTQITRDMPNEIPKILEHVPKYVASKPDKKYRKNPENYLKERVWMDDIVDSTKKPQDDTPKTIDDLGLNIYRG